jgi:ribonuclease HII
MSYVVGIDEVGRGSLAGPVTVTALAFPRGFRVRFKLPLRDSKKLTPSQREKWFEYCRSNPQILFATAHISPSVIDRIDVTQAANLAALKAFEKLLKKAPALRISPSIWLDGGLFLGRTKLRNSKGRPSPAYSSKATTVVRGDEKIPAIALASIMAKVTRDRLMGRLAKKFPEYGFEIHKGYGTKRHRVLLMRHGVTSMHRLTFLRKYPTIKHQRG